AHLGCNLLLLRRCAALRLLLRGGSLGLTRLRSRRGLGGRLLCPPLRARLRLGCLADDQGDVARALPDPVDAAAGAGAPALESRALVRVRGEDDELVAVEALRGLGVGDGRAE